MPMKDDFTKFAYNRLTLNFTLHSSPPETSMRVAVIVCLLALFVCCFASQQWLCMSKIQSPRGSIHHAHIFFCFDVLETNRPKTYTRIPSKQQTALRTHTLDFQDAADYSENVIHKIDRDLDHLTIGDFLAVSSRVSFMGSPRCSSMSACLRRSRYQ